MHYHLEIVMPPTNDIAGAVTEILKNYSEHSEDTRHGFYDWYVIGGRFAGNKFLARFDQPRLDKFYEVLTEKNVTVSGLTAGKQSLRPESQIPMVDALWNEYFPESDGLPCPLFDHSNDQYKSNSLLPDDVCRLADIPNGLTAERVMVANRWWKGEWGVTEMYAQSLWNGCTHQDTTFDGKVLTAVELVRERVKSGSDEYRDGCTPTDDWLVVTVDYHS